MNPLIEAHREEIVELCRTHGVRRLSLFGSAVKDTWNAETSDLDYSPGVGRRFMQFSSALERLLGTRIDIVTERSVTSSWFRDELDQTAVKIYEAGHDQAIA